MNNKLATVVLFVVVLTLAGNVWARLYNVWAGLCNVWAGLCNVWARLCEQALANVHRLRRI